MLDLRTLCSEQNVPYPFIPTIYLANEIYDNDIHWTDTDSFNTGCGQVDEWFRLNSFIEVLNGVCSLPTSQAPVFDLPFAVVNKETGVVEVKSYRFQYNQANTSATITRTSSE